jgi:hypothetical protein
MKAKIGTTVAAAASGAAALATLSMAARSWFQRWGATDEEIAGTWPGDELSPYPASEATRAITIHAPAAEVWPWLVQLGQDRGGFYSYTWLENLFGARMRNADRILPEHQSRQVGDTIWMMPRERRGGMGFVRVARLDPGRAMVLVLPEDYEAVETEDIAPHGTWALILEPVDDRTTRLIARSRSGAKQGAAGFLILDPVHFIMERRMMLGIRRRAEAEAAKHIEARAA